MIENKQPLVSVVMPVYNAERFLRQAVESVLNQSYQNIELIMVDDCSKDNSCQIMLEYAGKDRRVCAIRGEKNQGVARVRNRGIQLAKGEYIALLDSDDVWEKNKIERQIALLQEKNADIAYCSLDFIDENDKKIKKPFIVSLETNYKSMAVRCVFTCSTILAQAELLKQHPFRPEYYHEDFVLWMELMKLPVKAVGDQAVLMHNRQVSGSRSNNKLHAAKHRWKIYREALGMNLLQSCITFARYAVYGMLKYW